MGISKPQKLFFRNIFFNNEIIPDENFPDYGIVYRYIHICELVLYTRGQTNVVTFKCTFVFQH